MVCARTPRREHRLHGARDRLRRPDRHRHALPRRELGVGVAMEVKNTAPFRLHVVFACLGLAFLLIFSWVLFHEETRRVADDAGPLPAAREPRQESAPAGAVGRASAACARSGCPISGRVDRCATCHLGIDDPAFASAPSRSRRTRHVAVDASDRSIRLHDLPRRPGPGDRLSPAPRTSRSRSCRGRCARSRRSKPTAARATARSTRPTRRASPRADG